MKSAFGLAILAATLAAGLGHNDWSKPCFNGECAYDLPDHLGQSGTVKLVGIPTFLFDSVVAESIVDGQVPARHRGYYPGGGMGGP